MNFRNDINGLRAIAVIGVVLFHFDSSLLGGGYAGVDVFFVISGFLMTGVIFSGIEKNNFSIINFYVARANRIIPALAFLCICLFIFCWFFLTPLDARLLGQHIASSATFLSNFIYLREAGYFDPSSHGKWLLHTWSLSVEWQFYIIYPLLLVFLKKYIDCRILKVLVLIGCILGFIISVIGTYYWPSHAYYLLPTRFWEMLAGGVAYLYPLTLKDVNRRLLEIFGILLIIWSYFIFDKGDAWPGYLAVFPVIGAYLLILSNRHNSRLTNNCFMQKIGLWSYSIYLWHWPLVVLGIYYSFDDAWVFFGIILSVLLGYLSYSLIESVKFRKRQVKLHYIFLQPTVMFAFVSATLGAFLYLSDGLSFKFPDSIKIVAQEALNKNPRYKECLVSTGEVPECIYGEGDVGLIVFGDSHAGAIVRSVEGAKPASLNLSVLDWTMSGCPAIADVYRVKVGDVDSTCGDFVKSRLNILKAKYKNIPIVLSNRTAAYILGPNEDHLKNETNNIKYLINGKSNIENRGDDYNALMLDGMYQTLCALAETNPVYVLESIPDLKKNVPKAMSKMMISTSNKFRVKVERDYYDVRFRKVVEMHHKAAVQCGVKILSVTDYFCDSEYCYGDLGGRPLYFDDNHLSLFGADVLAPEYKKAWLGL